MSIEQLFHYALEEKRNVYLSGAGGCGKSYALKKLHQECLTRGITSALTSTTGVSAHGINGTTIHRWSGIKTGEKPIDQTYQMVSRSQAKKRWREVQVLVIDEVSMLGLKTFELLEELARRIREDSRPFGGIVMIFSGDGCQIPPINDDFWFLSDRWNELDPVYLRFEHPYRYPDPEHFQRLLRIRLGQPTSEDLRVLEERKKAYYEFKQQHHQSGEILPTRLFSRRVDVDHINQEELDKLPSDEIVYEATDEILYKTRYPEYKLPSYQSVLDRIIPPSISLKNGAQVMLVANLDVEGGLVNGSRGVIKSCEDECVIVTFRGEREVSITGYTWELDDQNARVSRTQIPLILGYASTLHRTQGATLDKAVIDLGTSVFSPNMAYVALSRCRELSGIYLINLDPRKIYTDPHSLAFEEVIRECAVENSHTEEKRE